MTKDRDTYDDLDDPLEQAFREYDEAQAQGPSSGRRLWFVITEILGAALVLWAAWYFGFAHYVSEFVDWLFGV